MAVIILPPSAAEEIHSRSRYLRGFKFCSSCHKWIAPGDEIYLDNGYGGKRRPRCPKCRLLLKTRPRGDQAKERVALAT